MPIVAAWREIKEETGLTCQDIELWRQGTPYSLGDPSIGREWIIYPFAFRLRNTHEGGRGEAAIKIDWEHDGWEWFNPKDVVDDESFGGVPRLAESLRRVYFEMWLNDSASRALHSGLVQLKNDHSSGSHELTTIGIKVFRDTIIYLENDKNWWDTVRIVAWHIWKNGRESMGSATLNALLSILGDLDQIKDRDLQGQWSSILSLVDRHLESRHKTATHIIKAFDSYLQSAYFTNLPPEKVHKLTVLTLSASSTIRNCILKIFQSSPISQLDLRILESRPLFEGASMAASLLFESQSALKDSETKRFHISVYTDAAAALAAQDVDFVLLGADRIWGSGSVSNKAGSLPAVLCAKHVSPRAKILVLSSQEKVAEPADDSEHQIEENNPAEVTNSWSLSELKGWDVLQEHSTGQTPSCSVTVRNPYFEWVPSELIDVFITEDGPMKPSAIYGKAVEVQRKTHRYFGFLWSMSI